MADRIFAGVLLLVSLIYTYIAFTAIRAPFQYDPLGPESWPRLLGIGAVLCTAWIVFRPDIESMNVNAKTLTRLVLLIALLSAYAALFQPLGFILSTFAFCTVLGWILGATPVKAVVFGAASGVLGYGICVVLLDLNLPAGILQPWL